MPSRDRDALWCLAQTKPNCQPIAERNLTRQGFRTFLPRHEETRRRNGRFVTQPKPLFPGYVFISLGAEPGGWRAINSTQGITRLVRFGQAPAAVPTEIVAQLMARCDAQGRLMPAGRMQVGDAVRLTRGPFADFVATVEEIEPDRRVWVLLELMGRESRLAVRPEALRPLAPQG